MKRLSPSVNYHHLSGDYIIGCSPSSVNPIHWFSKNMRRINVIPVIASGRARTWDVGSSSVRIFGILPCGTEFVARDPFFGRVKSFRMLVCTFAIETRQIGVILSRC